MVPSVLRFNIFNTKTTKSNTKYINNVWLQDLIQFMTDNGIIIITKDFFCNRPQRKNDKYIMEEMTKPKLTNTQMIQINACRTRLQVSFLSDMILPNEKYILK